MTRVFDLLPAVERLRDADQGNALEGLLSVAEAELDRLRADVDQLYDNWFIETCEDWVVAYLGDLVGVRGLGGTRRGRAAHRGLVANTIAYRRRKGTAAVLEQLAFDVTGWTAKAVEFFELLAWTQNVNHVRAGRGGTADIRDASRAELTATPFDTFAHTADVRHIDVGRGLHNIPNVGLFLWRLQSYPLERSTPSGGAGRFTFDPRGRDVPLFARPRAERDIGHLATELNVEGPLRRRPLRDELLAGVPATVQDDDGVERFLGPSDPAFRVFLDGEALAPSELAICDLGDPARMATPPAKAAVDPVRGRLALQSIDGRTPEVSWAYGFSGDLGGGPYDRRASVGGAIVAARAALPDEDWWQAGVVSDPPAAADRLFDDIPAALDKLKRKPLALISVMDNRTYDQPLEISVPGGCRLILAAGDWPERPNPLSGLPERRDGDITATRTRPHIAAPITIKGTPGSAGSSPGVLVLDGFLIDGPVTVENGSLGTLRIAHCTIGPAAGLTVKAGTVPSTRNVELQVELERGICGPLDVTEFAAGVRLTDSIVDGKLAVPDLAATRCTLLGETTARTIEGSECIFAGRLDVARRQTGCVRYSWLPPGSRAPRRFRCQPGDAGGAVTPSFTSTTYGDPGYAQLTAATPPEIGRGGEYEGEMGAFAFLGQPRRLADLRTQLDEYLRLGLEAGVYFVT
jgi:hypothetical protein